MSGITDMLAKLLEGQDKLLEDLDRQSMVLEELAADMKTGNRNMERLLNEK